MEGLTDEEMRDATAEALPDREALTVLSGSLTGDGLVGGLPDAGSADPDGATGTATGAGGAAEGGLGAGSDAAGTAGTDAVDAAGSESGEPSVTDADRSETVTSRDTATAG